MQPVITEDEKKVDYSELFFKPLPEVDPALIAELGTAPVAPERITQLKERNDILKPGYLEVENGYSVLPDGTGVVATKVEMPGVTPEMIDWWFCWHGLKDLRYKIWCPTQHYAIHVHEKDFAQRMDQSLSLKERNWGTTDVVHEDVGFGPQAMHLNFKSPIDYGYDPEMIKNVDVLVSATVTDPETGHGMVTFSHCVRKIPGGVEYRSHYWQGMGFDESGKEMVVGTPPGGFQPDILRNTALHSLLEYTNLAIILPQLYENYKDEKDFTVDHYKI